MTIPFMNYSNYEEWLKARTWGDDNSWLKLVNDLLHQGNTLEHGDWELSEFVCIAPPRRHSRAWLFENNPGKSHSIMLWSEAQDHIATISEDIYQWTANGVPLPDVFNAYCNLVLQMDKDVVFIAHNGEADYAGGQTYTDTLWRFNYQWQDWLIHVDESYDHPGVHEEVDYEYDGSTEEVHHLLFREKRMKDHLFKLHAKHSLLGFEPYELPESSRSLYQSIVSRRPEVEA